MIKLNHSAPVNFKERDFDNKLNEVSPQFVKVYNQALKTEEYSRDINDMKKFIDALVYFISMSLIVDDAETMKSKKENTANE